MCLQEFCEDFFFLELTQMKFSSYGLKGSEFTLGRSPVHGRPVWLIQATNRYTIKLWEDLLLATSKHQDTTNSIHNFLLLPPAYFNKAWPLHDDPKKQNPGHAAIVEIVGHTTADKHTLSASHTAAADRSEGSL